MTPTTPTKVSPGPSIEHGWKYNTFSKKSHYYKGLEGRNLVMSSCGYTAMLDRLSEDRPDEHCPACHAVLEMGVR